MSLNGTICIDEQNTNCILCQRCCLSVSKRGRLYGLESSIVLQLLQTEINGLGVSEIIPPRHSGFQGPQLFQLAIN